MARWEDEIFGKVRKSDWIDVGALPPARQNDPADGLFGDEKTNNIVAHWESIASQYSIPVMAQFHGFDTEAKTTFRVPIDTHNIEKGLIKVKINQSERLRELTRAGVQGDQALYDYVLQDGMILADQVVTRTKVAKNELLATGKVTISENNLDLTVDYGVPAAQTALELDLSVEADIDGQIQEIIDQATDAGVTITGIFTSKKNIAKMRRNKSLQVAINGNIGAGTLISTGALEAHFADEFGINTIITNDLTYGRSATIGADGRPSISQNRYFPQDKVTFFATNPGGKLGTGLWGDPPEVDAARFYEVNSSGVSPFVYIMQWMETDPAVLWTKASGLFIPVLYNPNSLFIATVKSEEVTPDITVKPSKATVAVGATKKLNATVVPEGQTVTWTSSDDTVATVSDGTVTGVATGSATITASITVGETTYEDVCNVTVSAGA